MITDIGRVDDFAEGRISTITVGRAEIGIVRWSGKIYAVSTLCIHQGAPLCQGVLAGRLTATRPGEMALDDTTPVIACPWHGWEFDVRTGEAIWDPRMRVRVYEVQVVGDRVLIETGSSSRAAQHSSSKV
jgi:nitrite reductase/ring-hydroxylating ferredoxin subunit